MIETTTEPQLAEEPPQRPTPAERVSAVARFLLLLAAVAAATVATGTTKTVAVVVALIVMIMLHEFGHFLTAKWGGMKVTEFFVGFGPRLWSFRKGETEYGVKA
ncbi:MAG: site-2 protease family protein, partial [Actinomycetota bacterium]|nr:site-2 protease family protein [Actinomycetota bacterium]